MEIPYKLTYWETEFIANGIAREFEIHDNANWETDEDAEAHLTRLRALAHKFKLDYLEEN